MEKITVDIEPEIVDILSCLIEAKTKFNQYLKEHRLDASISFEIGEFNEDIDACINTVVDVSSISVNDKVLKSLKFKPS